MPRGILGCGVRARDGAESDKKSLEGLEEGLRKILEAILPPHCSSMVVLVAPCSFMGVRVAPIPFF